MVQISISRTKVANSSNAQGGKAQNRGVANRAIQQRRPKRPFQDKGVAALPAVDWTTVELKEFRKCFVDTSKTPAKKYTEANIAKYYVEAEARVQGPLVDGKPSTVDLKAPYGTLKETPFPAVLQTELTKQGIPKPVPLQSISWPYIMSGRNFVGVAPSGLDKIYTYVLPAVVHVADQLANAPKASPAKPKAAPVVETPAEGEEKAEGEKEKAEPENDNGPIAVILTNLKKRGEQIMEILKPYQTAMNVTSHLIWGGSEKKKEAEDPVVDGLKENPHILVVALGQKFSDLLTGKQINLKKCTFLVLDDAGRIAKNLRYLENILGQVRTDRQLIMWTVSYGSANNAQDAIKHCTKFGFDDYVRIDFGAYGQFHNPSAVKQLVDPAVDQADRDKRFIFLVQTLLAASSVTTKKPKILVFSSTPARMRKVAETLLQTGLLSKSFYSKPLPPAVAAAAATKEEGAEKKEDAAAADKPAAGEEAAKEETKAEPEPEPEEEEGPVDDTPQFELNEAALHDNPLYHIWIANDNIPLEELDFGHFEFVINYDFPTELEAYEKRVLKYKAEGKGTLFSFILDSKQAKYVSAFMLESHQVRRSKNNKFSVSFLYIFQALTGQYF
jgi:superfamily II DNA/RNA helicase